MFNYYLRGYTLLFCVNFKWEEEKVKNITAHLNMLIKHNNKIHSVNEENSKYIRAYCKLSVIAIVFSAVRWLPF